jgi:hypothetical protein
MNGFEYSLMEIDDQLRGYVDHFSRRMCSPSIFTHVIEGQEFSVDQLLDMRNELVFLIGMEAVEEVYGTPTA